MTVVTAREAARQDSGRFGVQDNSAPEALLRVAPNVSGWGEWDDSEGQHLIDVGRVGLTSIASPEQGAVYEATSRWLFGDQEFGPPTMVQVSSVVSTMQPHLRRDALQRYLDKDREHEDTFDDELSLYGADGPLGVRNSDGTVTIIDGNHRFAAAKLRGDETFMIQLIG